MKRRGQVVALNGTSIRIQISRAGCERCQLGQGCGAGLMARLLVPQMFELELPLAQAPLSVRRVGAAVHISIPEATLVALAMRLFAATTLAFMLACGQGYWLTVSSGLNTFSSLWSDLITLLCGLLGAGLSWRYLGPMSGGIVRLTTAAVSLHPLA